MVLKGKFADESTGTWDIVNLCLGAMGAGAVSLKSLRFKALTDTAIVIDRHVAYHQALGLKALYLSVNCIRTTTTKW